MEKNVGFYRIKFAPLSILEATPYLPSAAAWDELFIPHEKYNSSH